MCMRVHPLHRDMVDDWVLKVCVVCACVCVCVHADTYTDMVDICVLQAEVVFLYEIQMVEDLFIQFLTQGLLLQVQKKKPLWD